MPVDRFIDEDLGFQVSWDGGELAAVTDEADPRLRWAAGALLDDPPAAALLLVTRAAFAATRAGERARIRPLAPPYVLLSSDGHPLPPRVLGDWDWREATKRFAARAIDRFAVDALGVSHFYWHGFPMLQLNLDVTTAPDVADVALGRSVAYLCTPQQTFTLFSDLMGMTDERLARAVESFYSSFHLIPRSREGRREQAHVLARMPFVVRAGELDGFRLP